MSVPSINDLTIDSDATLKDALRVIDKNAQGICFAVGKTGILKGILTDGDIRRALIKKPSFNTSVKNVMKTDFVSFNINSDRKTIQNALNEKITHIPLVDDSGKPVDYASYARLNFLPILEPSLQGNELVYVTDCIQTGWVSSQGKYVRNFERNFADYVEANYAMSVANGTVAIHLALETLGIGPEDEVILPDFTFAATINAVLYTGAKPVLVDIEQETWNIDPKEIEKSISPKTKAIIPVHIYGHPAKMDEIMQIAKKHNLLVIEDAAEALGSYYNNKHVGTMGDASTFSFYGNKTITTGEGGMVIFKDKAAFDKAEVLRDHGMSKSKRYWHDYIGYNYRMTNLQGALGCAQLEKVEEFVKQKIWLANEYERILSSYEGLFSLPPNLDNVRNSFWLYTVLLNEKIDRDSFMAKLKMNGIETRPTFYPLHQMPPYQGYKSGSYKNAIDISKRGISFPSSVKVNEDSLNHFEKALSNILSLEELI